MELLKAFPYTYMAPYKRSTEICGLKLKHKNSCQLSGWRLTKKGSASQLRFEDVYVCVSTLNHNATLRIELLLSHNIPQEVQLPLANGLQ